MAYENMLVYSDIWEQHKYEALNYPNRIDHMWKNILKGEYKLKIKTPEWLSLSKDIKMKLISLAILENPIKYPIKTETFVYSKFNQNL